jgi:hypothetical protein
VWSFHIASCICTSWESAADFFTHISTSMGKVLGSELYDEFTACAILMLFGSKMRCHNQRRIGNEIEAASRRIESKNGIQVYISTWSKTIFLDMIFKFSRNWMHECLLGCKTAVTRAEVYSCMIRMKYLSGDFLVKWRIYLSKTFVAYRISHPHNSISFLQLWASLIICLYNYALYSRAWLVL